MVRNLAEDTRLPFLHHGAVRSTEFSPSRPEMYDKTESVNQIVIRVTVPTHDTRDIGEFSSKTLILSVFKIFIFKTPYFESDPYISSIVIRNHYYPISIVHTTKTTDDNSFSRFFSSPCRHCHSPEAILSSSLPHRLCLPTMEVRSRGGKRGEDRGVPEEGEDRRREEWGGRGCREIG